MKPTRRSRTAIIDLPRAIHEAVVAMDNCPIRRAEFLTTWRAAVKDAKKRGFDVVAAELVQQADLFVSDVNSARATGGIELERSAAKAAGWRIMLANRFVGLMQTLDDSYLSRPGDLPFPLISYYPQHRGRTA